MLSNALQNWSQLKHALIARPLLVLLDYDGTLVPIVSHPRLAHLSIDAQRALKTAVHSGLKVAVVSGRELSELQKHVGVPKILYAGNHGLEFQGDGLQFVHPEALAQKNLFHGLCNYLRSNLKEFSGLWIEDKKWTLTVHYRQLAPERVQEAEKKLTTALQTYSQGRNLVIRKGKKTWEIRPPTPWNKGVFALWILARVNATSHQIHFPIYIGDDETDEDAFGALEHNGLTIRVASKNQEPTRAQYLLNSPREVISFLKELIALNKEKGLQHERHSRLRTTL